MFDNSVRAISDVVHLIACCVPSRFHCKPEIYLGFDNAYC